MPVKIEGLRETRRALRQFAPDLYKQMNNEIRKALREITYDVKRDIPNEITGLSNFGVGKGRKITAHNSEFSHRGFPLFRGAEVRSGIGYTMGVQKSNSRGYSAIYSIVNKSRVGAIIDVAGRKSGAKGNDPTRSRNPHASADFIEKLNAGIGEIERSNYRGNRKNDGRLIFAGVKRNEGKAKAAIFRALEKAIAEFNARGIKL